MSGIQTASLEDVRLEAEKQMAGLAPGAPVDEVTAALVTFAVRISVTSLAVASAADVARKALAAGATADELHETVFLVSALGVHSLFEGSRVVARLAAEGAKSDEKPPLGAELQRIWDATVGADKYWAGFECEVPGFLDALLRASPSGFDAFLRYCAVPWKSGHLPALTKELIAVATDATPTHRYLPGLRLHLRNAIKLGAGRDALTAVLDIAAKAPSHSGVG